MVNRFSASASEIAAAALQDYGRALIVGDTSTHGKGTVQNLNPLKPFIWPATDRDERSRHPQNHHPQILPRQRRLHAVQRRGAGHHFAGRAELFEAGRRNRLDNPLPWDTIQPANYEKLNLVQPYLATLKARSEARVATNQDFVYVEQDIEQY